MSTKTLTVGQRVRHDFLGDGTVMERPQPFSLEHRLVLVRWDESPPVRYNLGVNPCHEFLHTLTPIAAEEGQNA